MLMMIVCWTAMIVIMNIPDSSLDLRVQDTHYYIFRGEKT